MLKTILKKSRYWLLKQLFNDDEKYLILRSVQERYDTVRTVAIREKGVNKEDLENDCKNYLQLQKIFSTELWS